MPLMNRGPSGTESERRPVRSGLAMVAVAAVAAWLLGLAAPAGAHELPIWRVSQGPGRLLYLVGSMHALKPADYPLPASMISAFARSDVLVEEIDLNAIDKRQAMQTIAGLGMLPPNRSLAQAMGPDWARTRTLAKAAGVNLDVYLRSKPWFAAVVISDQLFRNAGYQAKLGLDRHFANLAADRGMPVIGLETLEGQLKLLDDIPLALQREFLLQTLSQANRAGRELAQLHRAWRTGDAAALERLAERDFSHFRSLRTELIGRRNRNWLPTLERCLTGGKTCFVVVGAEHMVGPHGLVALLRAKGCEIRQLGTGSAAPGRVQ